MSTLSRSHDGRWVAGVCSGLARGRGTHPAWIRAAFVIGALIGGLGMLVYLVCWLIIPDEGEEPGDLSSGWIVALAKACAASVAVVALSVLAAAATLFGFGWVALAAIALPSAAVAATGVVLVAQTGHETIAPKTLGTKGVATFRAGVGTLLVDLRGTALPASGVVPVRIQGGLRRTIVALPHDRCVHVELEYGEQPFLAQLATQVEGRSPFPGVVVFGNNMPNPVSGAGSWTTGAPGPTLKIDFTSTGGSLYVRDYPDSVDPEVTPDWPGYRVFPEARPDVNGLSKGQARYEIGAWRVRHDTEVRSQRLVNPLLPGPCASSGATQ